MRPMRLTVQSSGVTIAPDWEPLVRLAGSSIEVPPHLVTVFEWHDAEDGRLLVTVTHELEVVDGEPETRRVEIVAAPGAPPLTDLSQFRERWFVDRALELVGFVPIDGTTMRPDPERVRAELATRKRRRVTNDRLHAVADAYRRGGAQQVQKELHVSRSQAFRLVGQARDAQLLGKDENPS